MRKNGTRAAPSEYQDSCHGGWNFTLIASENSGLPNGMNISIGIGMNFDKVSRPTVKVSNIRGRFPHSDADWFRVLVDDGATIVGNNLTFLPDELAALAAWIELNAAVLLEAWFSETMDSEELLCRLAGSAGARPPQAGDCP